MKKKILQKILEWMVFVRNKVWSPILASWEKWRYPDLFKTGAEIRKNLNIHTVKQLTDYLQKEDFTWQSDPLGGACDYESYPEITLALKGGDCDDFARLAVELLGNNYQKVWKVYCYSGNIYEGHVMVLFYNENGWKLLSNTSFLDLGKEIQNPGEKAAQIFFGEKLFIFAVEKIKDN